MRSRLLLAGCLLVAFATHADTLSSAKRFSVQGRGFILDSSHPQRPDDAHRSDVAIRLTVDPARGDALLEFESEEDGKKTTDRYFIRRGRPFQIDDQKKETSPSSLGDLSPATIAALEPRLVAYTIASRPENTSSLDPSTILLAWNDELWRATVDRKSNLPTRMTRRFHHDVLGDMTETIRYSNYRGGIPQQITVSIGEREAARFDLTAAEGPVAPIDGPEESGNWSRRVVAEDDVVLKEVAPHIYTIDLKATDSRVTVTEFSDFVAVIEGAYNSRNCDLIARRIRETLRKPIRFFSFSHLHGQYLGGVRSYIHEGATILVPPTTARLIERVAKSTHELRPDALSRDPKPLHVETVKEKRVLEDDLNQLEVMNVPSGHTDEYLIFYFPRQKVLITGDLLCYRGAETPLRGRSKQLCETLTKLGVDPEVMYVSWPLGSYGCHDVVRGDEMKAACGVASAASPASGAPAASPAKRDN